MSCSFSSWWIEIDCISLSCEVSRIDLINNDWFRTIHNHVRQSRCLSLLLALTRFEKVHRCCLISCPGQLNRWWHWGIVIYNQIVTWRAFANLAMFSYEIKYNLYFEPMMKVSHTGFFCHKGSPKKRSFYGQADHVRVGPPYGLPDRKKTFFWGLPLQIVNVKYIS